MITVSAFYMYELIRNPAAFRQRHQRYCDTLGIMGKVLVAREGINGSVSGTRRQLAEYKRHVRQLFPGMTFKDTPSPGHPYRKMIVRLRPEIVTFGRDVDMSRKGRYVTPATLNKWIRNSEAILLDARNNYESRIGRFRGAITPDIEIFSRFPVAVQQLQQHRDKKIVTYCTGGIRCEKASAFLKQQGFQNVYQLKDGILRYIEQFPDSYFEGRCFVFDSRLSVPSGKKNAAISACDICHAACDDYINCKNAACDKMFICCTQCRGELEGACSRKCRENCGHTESGLTPGEAYRLA